MIPKLIRVLFYVLLILFPLGLLLRIKISTNIYIVPQDLIVFLIFVLTCAYVLKKRINIFLDKFILFQFLFVGIGLISLLVNVWIQKDINFLAAILYAVRYLSYLSPFFIGSFFMKSKFLSKALYLSGGTLVLIGFIQYFFYNNLRNLFYLGWDDHLYRLFSSFLDPNFAGVFYVLFFFYLLSKIIKSDYKNSYKELIFSFFTLVAIYLTYSRTALIALITTVVAIGIVSKKYKLLFVSIIVFLILIVSFSDLSVEGLNPFRTASSSERITSLGEAGHIIVKNPILGVGFNAYRYAQLRYGTRNSIGIAKSNADAGTDNSLIFVLATSGLAGLGCFVLSYFYLLKKLFNEHLFSSYIIACSIIGLIMGSLFLNVLFYTPIITWLLLVISTRKEFSTIGDK